MAWIYGIPFRRNEKESIRILHFSILYAFVDFGTVVEIPVEMYFQIIKGISLFASELGPRPWNKFYASAFWQQIENSTIRDYDSGDM